MGPAPEPLVRDFSPGPVRQQLISFARALLADPSLLVLDEATSGVDTQKERVIHQALARLLGGRTAFVIAHRLSTIMNANWILLPEGRCILEEGTHSDFLSRHQGYFRSTARGFSSGVENADDRGSHTRATAASVSHRHQGRPRLVLFP